MKKSVLTIAACVLLTLVSNAQSSEHQKARAQAGQNAETVNPDGTVTTGEKVNGEQAMPAATKKEESSTPQPAEKKKKEGKKEEATATPH